MSYLHDILDPGDESRELVFDRVRAVLFAQRRIFLLLVLKNGDAEFGHVSDDAFVLFWDLRVGDKFLQVLFRDTAFVQNVEQNDAYFVQGLKPI